MSDGRARRAGGRVDRSRGGAVRRRNPADAKPEPVDAEKIAKTVGQQVVDQLDPAFDTLFHNLGILREVIEEQQGRIDRLEALLGLAKACSCPKCLSQLN